MSDTSSPFQPPPFEEPVFSSEDELEEDLEDEDDELDDGDADDDADDDEEENDDEGEDENVRVGNDVAGGAARAVLEHVARSIVDEPEAVVVEVGEGRSGVKLSLHVAPSDMGRIIGKRGRVAQAMRALVRAAAASEGTDASVDIVD